MTTMNKFSWYIAAQSCLLGQYEITATGSRTGGERHIVHAYGFGIQAVLQDLQKKIEEVENSNAGN